MSTSQMNPQVWAFGGAKGGVGRSVICAATAFALVQQGKKVIALDFDLGSANLHTLMGIIQPKRNLEQWILGQANSLADVCSPTSLPGLSLISGGASIYNPSHPSPEQLKRLLQEALALEADYILIDLGAGIHPHTLDFFNVAGRSFIITTPEPTAIQNTYAFFKASLIRRIEVVLGPYPWLRKILQRAASAKGNARITSIGQLLNMLQELDGDVNRKIIEQLQSLKAPLIINRAYAKDEEQVLQALKKICEQFLHFKLKHALTISEDKSLRNAIRQLLPVHELSTDSSFMSTIQSWIEEDLKTAPYTPIQEDFLELVGTPSFLSVHSSKTNSQVSQETVAIDVKLLRQQKASVEEQVLRSAIQDLQHQAPMSPLISNTALSNTEANATISKRDWKSVAWTEEQQGQNTDAYDIYTPSPQIQDADLQAARSALIQAEEEVLDDSYIEPLPIEEVEMEDPPLHEVISFEEEVKTDSGWFHLKTVDLAPFRPAIRTSIYQTGSRLVAQDESYLGLYQQGIYSTEIAKKVERIHHQNKQLLQAGGVEAWLNAH